MVSTSTVHDYGREIGVWLPIHDAFLVHARGYTSLSYEEMGYTRFGEHKCGPPQSLDLPLIMG